LGVWSSWSLLFVICAVVCIVVFAWFLLLLWICMLRVNFFYVVVVAAFIVGVVFVFVSEMWFDIGCRRKFASSLSVLLKSFVELSIL
jgi:hypothetical protein